MKKINWRLSLTLGFLFIRISNIKCVQALSCYECAFSGDTGNGGCAYGIPHASYLRLCSTEENQCYKWHALEKGRTYVRRGCTQTHNKKEGCMRTTWNDVLIYKGEHYRGVVCYCADKDACNNTFSYTRGVNRVVLIVLSLSTIFVDITR